VRERPIEHEHMGRVSFISSKARLCTPYSVPTLIFSFTTPINSTAPTSVHYSFPSPIRPFIHSFIHSFNQLLCSSSLFFGQSAPHLQVSSQRPLLILVHLDSGEPLQTGIPTFSLRTSAILTRINVCSESVARSNTKHPRFR
jgi:hypothetical protein